MEEEHVDWVITRPYMFLVVLNLAGLAFGVWRLAYGPTDEVMTVIISLVWVLYNMTILGGAVAVAVEAKQVRQAHRVKSPCRRRSRAPTAICIPARCAITRRRRGH